MFRQQCPHLQTKLVIPPVRPELVSRSHLIARLNAGLGQSSPAFGRKLTLTSAPAGCGKTTLVGERGHKVASHREVPLHLVWLALVKGDNDPARFLAYVIAAEPSTELSGVETNTPSLSYCECKMLSVSGLAGRSRFP